MDSSNKDVIRGKDDSKHTGEPYTAPPHFSGSATQDYNELAQRITHRHDHDSIESSLGLPASAADHHGSDIAHRDHTAIAAPGTAGPAGPAGEPVSHDGFTNRFDELVRHAAEGITQAYHVVEKQVDHALHPGPASSSSSSSVPAPMGSAAEGAMDIRNESFFPSSTTTTTAPSDAEQALLSPALNINDAGSDFSLWQAPAEKAVEAAVKLDEPDTHVLPSPEEIEAHNYAPDRPLQAQKEERRILDAATRDQMAEGK